MLRINLLDLWCISIIEAISVLLFAVLSYYVIAVIKFSISKDLLKRAIKLTNYSD